MRRRHAFTLVELLVVIGIIALLISILLPALGRARAQANLIDCQARLRQIGQGLQLYASQNNGLFPWGALDHDAGALAGFPNPHGERWWKWSYTISQYLGTDEMNPPTVNYWPKNNPVFTDKDTIEGNPWGWVTHYVAHPRIMPQNNGSDPYKKWDEGTSGGKQTIVQRRMASIRNASEVMAVWDAPQWCHPNNDPNTPGYGNSVPETAQAIGGWQFFWGSFLVTPNPDPVNTPWVDGMYNQPIQPGGIGGGAADVLQKQWNKDFSGESPWQTPGDDPKSMLRFRHLQNTMMNGLFADGHCESRKVGSALLKDFCTSWY